MRCLLTCATCGAEKIVDFHKESFEESKALYEREDIKEALKHPCEGEWNIREYESSTAISIGENKQNNV